MSPHATRPRHILRRLLAAAAISGLLAWSVGFVWFLQVTTRPPAPPPTRADGIVALTGGAGRVELALRLLAANEADKLLVSGIGANTDLPTLGRLAGMDLVPLAWRITLGRQATSTRGNAMETAAWAAQNGVRSIIVVTASYHMPRALVELRHALPEATLFPLPVQPPAGDPDHAAAERQPGARPPAEDFTRYLRSQAEEYSKYLLAVAGLSPWFPHREAAPAPHQAAAVPWAANGCGCA